nr:unnamed protein product [Callosobruchus analis]
MKLGHFVHFFRISEVTMINSSITFECCKRSF